MRVFIADPGHGMSNRKPGVYDSGATSGKFQEASIVMDAANILKAIWEAAGHKVVRTRKDQFDPAPVSARAEIAKKYGGEVMVSLHCNAYNGKARGTECLYRGAEHKAKAAALSKAVAAALGIPDRGPKDESVSPHGRLAVMAFQPTYLIELGFIDNDADRAAMLDPEKLHAACLAIAGLLG